MEYELQWMPNAYYEKQYTFYKVSLLSKLFCGISQIMKIERPDLFRDKDLRALLHNQGFPIKVQHR